MTPKNRAILAQRLAELEAEADALRDALGQPAAASPAKKAAARIARGPAPVTEAERAEVAPVDKAKADRYLARRGLKRGAA